jgi:hypothetical protein
MEAQVSSNFSCWRCSKYPPLKPKNDLQRRTTEYQTATHSSMGIAVLASATHCWNSSSIVGFITYTMFFSTPQRGKKLSRDK